MSQDEEDGPWQIPLQNFLDLPNELTQVPLEHFVKNIFWLTAALLCTRPPLLKKRAKKEFAPILRHSIASWNKPRARDGDPPCRFDKH